MPSDASPQRRHSPGKRVHNHGRLTPGRRAGLPALVMLSAALLLAACGKGDSRSAGQQVDAAIAQAGKTTDNATATAKKELEQAKTSTEAAAAQAGKSIDKATSEMATKVENSADTVGIKVDDARITVSVNAELAEDPALSALRINVDTSAGRVLLKGSAPDKAARDRAGKLAAGVRGVNSVDNQLDVRS